MFQKSSLRLNCFSPPVMLATFAIEIMFALYTIWRYKTTTVTRLAVAILLILAGFQGTEFLLCGGLSLPGGVWSRIGYSTITLLPPLGIHMAHALAGKKAKLLVGASYASAAVFVGYYAFMTSAISGHTCYANYVTFDAKEIGTFFYGVYYYGWLVVGSYLTFTWTKDLTKNRRSSLYALLVGYLALLIPTATVTIIAPETSAGIPSIMCGFAVILAAILSLKVVPDSTQPVKAHSTSLKLFRPRFPF